MVTPANDFNYDVQKYPWVTPRYVFEAYDALVAEFGLDVVLKNKTFEKALEARAVAICLLGVSKSQSRPFYMQIERSNSPDIITMAMVEMEGLPVQGFFQEVELVTFDDNSGENDIVDFLARTKLDKRRYSFDEKTIILCEIGKHSNISYPDLNKRLAKLGPRPTVMTLGKVSATEQVYEICQVWPEVTLRTVINVPELALSYPEPHILNLTKGTDQKITIKKGKARKPSYFEVFWFR